MDDPIGADRGEAAAVCAMATDGESIEVRASGLTRRKHQLTGGRIRSSATVTTRGPYGLRLAREGREAHLLLDTVTAAAVRPALAELRELLPHARRYRDRIARHPVTAWNADRYLDPDPPLAACWERLRTAAAIAGDRLGLGITVLDALVTVEQHAELLVGSARPAAGFGYSRSEIRILVQVRAGERHARFWTSWHANRLDGLPLEQALTDAGLRGAAMLAAPGPHRDGPLLLAPHTGAALLRVLAHDLFADRGGRRLTRRPRWVPVDDAQAPGGQHCRPIDHEGTPTGTTPLLDPSGESAGFAVRGTEPGDELTGNAYMFRGFGAPEPQPTNVRLEPMADAGTVPGPEGLTGRLGLALHGGGTQRFRSGDLIRFRIDTAQVRDGAVVGRGEPLLVAATAAELVTAISAAAPTGAYLPWRDFSTSCSWIRFDEMPGRG